MSWNEAAKGMVCCGCGRGRAERTPAEPLPDGDRFGAIRSPKTSWGLFFSLGMVPFHQSANRLWIPSWSFRRRKKDEIDDQPQAARAGRRGGVFRVRRDGLFRNPDPPRRRFRPSRSFTRPAGRGAFGAGGAGRSQATQALGHDTPGGRRSGSATSSLSDFRRPAGIQFIVGNEQGTVNRPLPCRERHGVHEPAEQPRRLV